MPLLDGISYEEMEKSGALSYDADGGWRGERIFKVAWDDRVNFCQALLGWSDPIGGFGIRVRGKQFPGFDLLFCRSVDVDDLGELSQGSEMASYPEAKVTAGYRPHNFTTSTTDEDEEYDEEVEEGLRHLNEEWDFAGEFLTVPEGSYVWHDDVSPVEGGTGIIVGNIDVALTSTEEPLLYRNRIADAVGTVNSTRWYGWNAGYMMFMGASARRTITVEGIGAWEITYRFRGRTVPHNEFYKPGLGGGWTEIRTRTGVPPYASYDFHNLFA